MSFKTNMGKPSTPISMESSIKAMLKRLKNKPNKEDKKTIQDVVKHYVQSVDNKLQTSKNVLVSIANVQNDYIKCLECHPKTFLPEFNCYTYQQFQHKKTVCEVTNQAFLESFFNWDTTTQMQGSNDNIRFTLADKSWIEFKGKYTTYPTKQYAKLELLSIDQSTQWKLKKIGKDMFQIELCYFFYEREPNSSNAWFHIEPKCKRFARDILRGMKNTFIQMIPTGSEALFELKNWSVIPPVSFTNKTANDLAGVFLTPLRVVQGQLGFYEECGFYDTSDINEVLQKRVTRVSFKRMTKHQRIHTFRLSNKLILSQKRERQFWKDLKVSKTFIKETKKMLQ